jgi:hypothetical protein
MDRKLLLALSMLFFLLGCETIKNKARLQPDPPPELNAKKQQNDLLGTGWLKNYHDRLRKGHCPDDSPPLGGQCNNGPYAHVMEAERNSYISAIEEKINENYDNFAHSLYAGHAYMAVTTDLAVIGLSGASSVIADAGLQSILAVASGGVVGATSSFDKQVLNQQNTLAIIATMDGQRAAQHAVIVQREQGDINTYPLELALLDLRKLYAEGTVLAALQAIQGSAQDKKQAAQGVVDGTLHLAPLAPPVAPAPVAPAPVAPAPVAPAPVAPAPIAPAPVAPAPIAPAPIAPAPIAPAPVAPAPVAPAPVVPAPVAPPRPPAQ